MQSKVNAYDFYHTLVRLTDGSGLSEHKVSILYLLGDRKSTHPLRQSRYPEWRRATRCHGNMQSAKWAGCGHDPGGVKSTEPGGFAVECPLCPHKGRNVPVDLDNVPYHLRCAFFARHYHSLRN